MVANSMENIQTILTVLISFCVCYSQAECQPGGCSLVDLEVPDAILVRNERDCYQEGENVTFDCQDQSKTLVGPPYNECQNDTSWKYGSNPVCEDRQSCLPFTISNGGYRPGNTENGDGDYTVYEEVDYFCNNGYTLLGPDTATCTLGGLWSPSAEPVCLGGCDQPPAGTNGEYGNSGTDEYIQGATVQYNCNNGYTGEDLFRTCGSDGNWIPAGGPICTDVDECNSGVDVCVPATEVCTNTDGSFFCSCAEGYTEGNDGCSDVDECNSGVDVCDPETEVCTNTDGSFFCSCAEGYTEGNDGCSDIDECNSGVDDCDPETEVCTNTDGSFFCSCAEGYTEGNDGCSVSEEVTLDCTPTHLVVTINRQSLAAATEPSDVVFLGDQTCRASESQDPNFIIISSSYSSCGTRVMVSDDYVEYRNVIIDADNASLDVGEKILIPVRCSFTRREYIEPRSQLDDFILSKSVSRTSESAKFDFLAYLDEEYNLPLPGAEAPLTFDTTHFFEIRSEYHMSVEVGVEECWASSDNGNIVSLIQAGCAVDADVVTVLQTDDYTKFRFSVDMSIVDDLSSMEASIHCNVVACDVNNQLSMCKHDCEMQMERRRRSLEGFIQVKRLTIGRI